MAPAVCGVLAFCEGANRVYDGFFGDQGGELLEQIVNVLSFVDLIGRPQHAGAMTGGTVQDNE